MRCALREYSKYMALDFRSKHTLKLLLFNLLIVVCDMVYLYSNCQCIMLVSTIPIMLYSVNFTRQYSSVTHLFNTKDVSNARPTH